MMTYTKYIKYAYYLILLTGVVLTFVFFMNAGWLTDNMAVVNTTSVLDVYLGWGYALILLNVLAMVILPLPFMSKASYKRLGIVTVLFIVLFAVSYMFANGNPVDAVVKVQPTESVLKMTDAGLKFTYILFGISLAAILFSSLYKSVILPRLNN